MAKIDNIALFNRLFKSKKAITNPLKDIPEAAIKYGIAKPLEYTVKGVTGAASLLGDILKDYKERPVQNISLDVATGGAAKFAPLLGGLVRGGKEHLRLYRGLKDTRPDEVLSHLDSSYKNIVGKHKGPGQTLTYTSPYKKVSEGYTMPSGSISGLKVLNEKPSTLLQFDVPLDWVDEVNAPAISFLRNLQKADSKYYGHSYEDILKLRELTKVSTRIPSKMDILNKFPGINPANRKTLQDIIKNVEGDKNKAWNAYHTIFSEGVPARFLTGLDELYVPQHLKSMSKKDINFILEMLQDLK